MAADLEGKVAEHLVFSLFPFFKKANPVPEKKKAAGSGKPAADGFLTVLLSGRMSDDADYLNSIWEYSNPASGWM